MLACCSASTSSHRCHVTHHLCRPHLLHKAAQLGAGHPLLLLILAATAAAAAAATVAAATAAVATAAKAASKAAALSGRRSVSHALRASIGGIVECSAGLQGTGGSYMSGLHAWARLSLAPNRVFAPINVRCAYWTQQPPPAKLAPISIAALHASLPTHQQELLGCE